MSQSKFITPLNPTVWDGLSNQLSDKLQKLQNRAARVILKAHYETSSTFFLEPLKWDKLVVRRTKQKAIMVFKSLSEFAPVYLQDLQRTKLTVEPKCEGRRISEVTGNRFVFVGR